MRPEDLTVALRPRQPWEAADLGCALVRRDIGQILILWSVTVLPLMTLLALVMQAHPAWYTAAVWWLKPLYDRVPLHVLSRSAFGVKTNLIQGLRALPGLWCKFLLPALLWRRLSPARSFVMPVWMLEGQRGAKLRNRASVLAGEGGSSGATLTWVFIKLEIAVFIGLLALTSFIAPDSGYESIEEMMAVIEDGQFTFPDAWYWWYGACYALAVSIVEPFYVGAGFGLYLNCRSKLEGWDVELAFRQTTARLIKSASPVMALLMLVPAAGPLVAQNAESGALPGANNLAAAARQAADSDTSPRQAPPVDGNELAKRILGEPDFEVHTRTNRVWVPAPPAVEGPISPLFAETLSLVGYLLLALLLLFLILWLARKAMKIKTPALMQKAQQPETATPTLVLGLRITPESLPGDLLAAARAAWTRGDPREALSLLYRGALSTLVDRRQLPIRASDTEDDCRERVRRAESPALSSYFDRLTQLWTHAAYAGQPPAPGDFDNLCRDWPFATLDRLPARREKMASAPAAVLLLLCGMLAGCKGEWVEETRELGHRGKARIDPFLATQRFMEKRGHITRRAPNLANLPPSRGGLVLTSAESGMPTGRAKPLLHWVSSGGHLIYALAGTAPYNDWSAASFMPAEPPPGEGGRQDPILVALGVSLREAAKKQSDGKAGPRAEPQNKDQFKKDKKVEAILQRVFGWELVEARLPRGGQTLTLELPDSPTFHLDRALRKTEFQAATDSRSLLLSLRHGQGRITLINHARPLRNRHLADLDHGRLLDLLLGDEVRLEALFVVGLEGSFWSLLRERAWRVLLALAILLAVWLWAVLPRFGPVRTAMLHPVRRFADHLETLGHFYFKANRQQHLIASAQAALRRRLRETHPHLSAPADQERFLAGRAGLPVEQVATTLADPATLPSAQLVRLLQNLQHLRHSLS